MRLAQEPTKEQLLNIAEGSRLAAVEDEMAVFVEKMMWQTQQRIFRAIADGTLTPELAVQGWHELNASFRLLQKYKQTIKVGQTTGLEVHKGEVNG